MPSSTAWQNVEAAHQKRACGTVEFNQAMPGHLDRCIGGKIEADRFEPDDVEAAVASGARKLGYQSPAASDHNTFGRAPPIELPAATR